MKRFAVIFLTAALLIPLRGWAQIDPSALKALDSKLDEYFRTLETQPVGVKNEECDLLIGSAGDSLLRQHIALKAYTHYLDSSLMGDEAVAVHLTDTWFATGLVSMGGDDILLRAKMFADFNRRSLIGEPAPELRMPDPQGDTVEFGGVSFRYRVLFFYDTGCSKCRLESSLLKSGLDSADWPVDVYAVYTGSEPESWKEWRETRFNLNARAVRTFNVWDPDISSDYQMKYGVLQTPKMFLVDPQGTVIGRGLDTEALCRMLGSIFSDRDYEYGGRSSAALMDTLFSAYAPISPGNVSEVASVIGSRTLGLGDTLTFKHLEGDLLYWLLSRRDEGCREGTAAFMNEYVLSRPEIWNTADDTLKVVGLARMMNELLSRTPVGSRIPKMKEIAGWNALRRRGGFIIFHSRGCPVCRRELAAADSLGLRVLDVDVDGILASDPDLGKLLLDTFDLSSMPFIVEVSGRGTVRRRYVSFTGKS